MVSKFWKNLQKRHKDQEKYKHPEFFVELVLQLYNQSLGSPQVIVMYASSTPNSLVKARPMMLSLLPAQTFFLEEKIFVSEDSNEKGKVHNIKLSYPPVEKILSSVPLVVFPTSSSVFPRSIVDEDCAELFRVSVPLILLSAMACLDKTSCNYTLEHYPRTIVRKITILTKRYDW